MSKGAPFLVRVWSGLLKPKYQILGADIAGRVEAVGKNVKQFQPGDEVFGDISGDGWGGFAEYVTVSEGALLLKPDNLTFEEAAAVPQAAVVALQGRFGTTEVVRVDLDSGAVTKLTDAQGRAVLKSPALSPDGLQVAYAAHRGDGWKVESQALMSRLGITRRNAAFDRSGAYLRPKT